MKHVEIMPQQCGDVKGGDYGSVLGICFGFCCGRNDRATSRPFRMVQGFIREMRQRPSMKYRQWKESTLPFRSTEVYSTGSRTEDRWCGTSQMERIVWVGSVRLQTYRAKAYPAPKPETAPAIKTGSRIEVSIQTIIAQRGGM